MLFARQTGNLEWACPACNTIHRDYVSRQYKALQCSNCRARFEHGVVLYQSPRGPSRIPRDVLMIASGFVNRRLVNRVYCDHCHHEIAAILTKALLNSAACPPVIATETDHSSKDSDSHYGPLGPPKPGETIK